MKRGSEVPYVFSVWREVGVVRGTRPALKSGMCLASPANAS